MGLMLSQHKYALDFLSRDGMSSYKPINTPASISKVNLQPSGLYSYPTRYWQIIGLLDQTSVMLSTKSVCLCMHLLRAIGLLLSVFYGI